MAVVGEPERESIHLLPEEVPGSWSSTQWGVLANKGLAGSVRGCCLRTGSGGAARSSASHQTLLWAVHPEQGRHGLLSRNFCPVLKTGESQEPASRQWVGYRRGDMAATT